MKKVLVFTVLITLFFAAFAQSPKISYQAILRDANNRLVTNTEVTVDATITYGSDTYTEKGLTTTTNANGLFSLEIGSVDGYEAINWNNATITTVVTYGDDIIENTTPVTAVPYALKAKLADDVNPSSTALTEVYNKIYNDSVALHKAIKDTANALRNAIPTVQDQINADWDATSGAAEILHKPAFNDGVLTFKLLNGTDITYTANQQGNTEVNIVLPKMSVQDFLDVLSQMTPEQITALRDSLGIPEPETFTCGTSKISDVDGNTYETVQIGEQCWTKTNLRTTKYRNGGAIPENQQASLGTASLYRPSTSDAVTEHYTDSIYGMYYNWYVVKGDTLCPVGWHVPTQAEWEQLTTFMSSQSRYWCSSSNSDYIAKALAGTHHYTNQDEETIYAWANEDKNCAVGSDRGDIEKTNTSGFSAFPAGYWSTTFQGYRISARFWTSTPEGDDAWVNTMSYSEEMLRSYLADKGNANSVRCVKDN